MSDPEEIRQLATAFNEMAESIQQKTNELSHSNFELEQFAYSVAHDLRAPLRALSGFSGIVLDSHASDLPDEGLRYLGLIQENAQEMGRLIDGLLTLSRLGRQVLDIKLITPSDLVQEVLDMLLPEEENRQIEVTVGNLPTCQADVPLLKQVFANLLSNAIKFTRQQEVAHIEIGWQGGEGGGAFFVRDNGTGFDMRYVNKLFGVFQRLHGVDEFEGSGIGLAIVRSVVQRHKGRVWAEGEVGKGATFYFTLGKELMISAAREGLSHSP